MYYCHLHPLQAANCCRNSRLVVDEDNWMWLKIKENCHVLVIQFPGNFRLKTFGCRKIKSVFRDVKCCFNGSWCLKGLILPSASTRFNVSRCYLPCISNLSCVLDVSFGSKFPVSNNNWKKNVHNAQSRLNNTSWWCECNMKRTIILEQKKLRNNESFSVRKLLQSSWLGLILYCWTNIIMSSGIWEDYIKLGQSEINMFR